MASTAPAIHAPRNSTLAWMGAPGPPPSTADHRPLTAYTNRGHIILRPARLLSSSTSDVSLDSPGSLRRIDRAVFSKSAASLRWWAVSNWM